MLDRTARDSLRPLAGGLAVLFVVFTVSHTLFLSEPARTPLAVMAFVSAVICAGLYLFLGRRVVPPSWANPLVAALCALPLANTVAHGYLRRDGEQIFYLMLIALGSGFVVLSPTWLIVVLAAAVASWLVIVFALPPVAGLPPFTFQLMTVVGASLIVHAARVTTTRRLGTLRLQDEHRQRELQAASAAAQESQTALRRHNEYLAALHDTTVGLISHLDWKDLLETIVTRAAQLVGTQHGNIYLVEPRRAGLELKVGTGVYAGSLGMRLKSGEGLSGKVWQTAAPLVVNDYDQWAGRSANFPPGLIGASMGVPLKSGAHVIGVIGLSYERNSGRTFGNAEVELLERFAQLASIALDNARWIAADRERATELEALSATVTDLSSELELTRLLNSVLERAVGLLAATGGQLSIYDEASDELEVVASYRQGENYVGTRMQMGEGVMGRAAQQREPIIIADYQRWEGRSRQYSNVTSRAVAAVPLLVGKRLVGAIGIGDSNAERTFTPADVRRLKLFAQQAAVAIHNAKLFEEAKQRAAELDSLLKASLSLTSRLELREALNIIVESAYKIVPEKADARVHVFLYDGERITFGVGMWDGKRQDKPFAEPRRRGLTYLVAEHGQPILVPDIRLHSLYRGLDWDGAIVSLPLKIGSRVVGVMNFSYSQPREFSESEMRVLRLLADQAAVTIENARLYDAAQQRAAELNAALQATLSLTSSLDLRSVLDTIAESAFRLLHAPRAINIFLYQDGRLTFGSAMQAGRRLERPVSEPRPGGLTDTVARSGETVVVPDMRAHPLYANAPSSWQGAIVGLPLKIGERVVGVMNCSYETARDFSQADLRVLRLLADHAAVAIENARLYSAVQHELAERTRAEEEIKRARDAAESANRAKSTFLANVSHELRTPLNAIIGYSEMLQEGADELGHPEFGEDLQRIHTAGKQLLGLISDILDLSKIEAGKMDLYLETFDLPAIVHEVVGLIEPLAEKNGNRMHVSVADTVGAFYADAMKVRQALYNLLSNACKFTSQGDIWLSVRRETLDDCDGMTFSVKDTGIGMTPEQMGRLFQAFSQADASTTRRFGGSGLGLAITRHFCQMMGGDIRVESESGKGATFTIRLPMRGADDERPKSDGQASVGEALAEAGEREGLL